ncbi:MAG TPA: ParA family protein [Hyphomicrobiaceae bacterium]|nr:ParA family protein [Hyphomicrobiaceae bacterium]
MRAKQAYIVALAATKGGVGKTTLAAALAVRAMEDGARVALIDADPQASLARWWELRGEPDNPRVLDVPCGQEAIGLVAAEGFDWVIVDTPPALIDEISAAVNMAHYAIVPVRPSAIDIEAVDQVKEICETLGKPFAFLLNAVQPTWRLTEQAERYLESDGKVLPARICYRKAYISAMTLGKTGPELERDGKCREEIDALWALVKAQTRRAARAR